MKTAIFGGSFNPVHNGHVRLLENAVAEFGFDRVFVIPTNIPPHKSADEFVSDFDRLSMCSVAFSEIDGAVVSDYEMKKGGVSYSFDTVSHFKEKYPDDDFYFIMGSDMLLTFDKWYRYEEILLMTSLICTARNCGEYDTLLCKAKELDTVGNRIFVMKTDPFEISSSQVREMIRNGDDVSRYLPQSVAQYIKLKNLYLE